MKPTRYRAGVRFSFKVTEQIPSISPVRSPAGSRKRIMGT
jgi:hypothetical protein